jgi:hypothetical protein
MSEDCPPYAGRREKQIRALRLRPKRARYRAALRALRLPVRTKAGSTRVNSLRRECPTKSFPRAQANLA